MLPASSSYTESRDASGRSGGNGTSDVNVELPMLASSFKMMLQEAVDQLESSLDRRFLNMWQQIVGITAKEPMTMAMAAQLRRTNSISQLPRTNSMPTFSRSSSQTLSEDNVKALNHLVMGLDAKLNRVCKQLEGRIDVIPWERPGESLEPGKSSTSHLADLRQPTSGQLSSATSDLASKHEPVVEASADGFSRKKTSSGNSMDVTLPLGDESKPVIMPHPIWVDGLEEKRPSHAAAERLNLMLRTETNSIDAPQMSPRSSPTIVTKKEDVEKERQQGCRLIVHPSATKRLMWDMVGMTLIAFDTIWLPLYLSFEPTASEVTEFPAYMFWVTLVFWNTDILLAFFTGYYDDGEVVLQPMKIARNYVTSWFLLDCVLVGIDYMTLFGGDRSGTGLMRMGKAARGLGVLRSLRVLRLLRLVKLMKILEELQDRISSAVVNIGLSILKLILILLVCNHLIACLWWAVGRAPPSGEIGWIEYHGFQRDELEYNYLSSLHWTLTQFTPAAMEVVPHNSRERAFAVVLLIFALLFFSSFLSSITSAMTQLRQLNYATNHQFALLRRFLREREVSPELSARIKKYLEHRIHAQKQRVQEHDVSILVLLSEPLHKELQEETYKPLLCRHPFFDHYCTVAPHAMRHLCHDSLSTISLSAGDTLFRAGDKCEQMVFVIEGRLLYEWPGAAHVEPTSRYLEGGDWCGEACLWTNWAHTGSMQAVSNSNLLAVDAAKFIAVTEQHTIVTPKASLYAQKFVEDLNSSVRSLSDMSESTEEIERMAARAFFPEQDQTPNTKTPSSNFVSRHLGPRFGYSLSVSSAVTSLKKAIRSESIGRLNSNAESTGSQSKKRNQSSAKR